MRNAFLRIQKKRGDATVTQFPDGAIEDEVVDVDQGGENQKAGGEVIVKNMAGKPGSGDKESDASGDKDCKITNWTPTRDAFCSGFSPRVITCDSEILRGMHYCEHTATVAALRDAHALAHGKHCWQQEPDKLGGE